MVASATTFLTLCYILLVQPTVLATTGMDFSAVLAATCLASAFATLLMGLYANYPIALAPALIVVGSLMLRGVARVPWTDPTEAISAFLTIILMPFSLSITDGITFGLVSYSRLKLATGQPQQAHWLIHLFAGLLALRYVVA